MPTPRNNASTGYTARHVRELFSFHHDCSTAGFVKKLNTINIFLYYLLIIVNQ